MYKLIALYNDNGVLALVQEKNLEPWLAKGWKREKPGGDVVEAYEKRAEAFVTKKSK